MNLAVFYVCFSSSVIYNSWDLYIITCPHKILITVHSNFSHSIVSTTTATTRVGDLLFPYHAKRRPDWLEDIQILGIKLILIFTIWRYQLCCKWISNVTIVRLEHAPRQLGRKKEFKRESVVPTLDQPICEYCQLEKTWIGVLCIRVMPSVFTWSLTPTHMLNSLNF